MDSAHSFVYEQCDVPAGMSLVDWRRARPGGRRRRMGARLALRWAARLLSA